MYKPKYGNETDISEFKTPECNYYAALATYDHFDKEEPAVAAGAHIQHEIAAVGAGVGGGFDHTTELKVRVKILECGRKLLMMN